MEMRELEFLDLSVKFRHVARWRGLEAEDADALAFDILRHLLDVHPNPEGRSRHETRAPDV